MQQRLKPASGAAWARIISAQFLEQLLVTVDGLHPAFHSGFRIETTSDACSSGQKQNGASCLSPAMTRLLVKGAHGVGVRDGTVKRRRMLPAAREVAQHLDLELLVADQRADEVANADDADNRAVLDDRQVADAVHGHQLHRLVHAVLDPAGDDVLSHHLADRKLGHGVAEAIEPMDEVALAEDADMPAPAVGDEEGADIVLGKFARRFFDRVGSAYLVDHMIVMTQNIGDAHGPSGDCCDRHAGCGVAALRQHYRIVKNITRASRASRADAPTSYSLKIRIALPLRTAFIVASGSASTRLRQPFMSPMLCG